MVVEVDNRDVQTVDLRESDFAFAKGFGDALRLAEQQVAIVTFRQRAFLEVGGAIALNAPKAVRASADEDAIRSQRRALGIDANSSVGGTARVQPAHDQLHGVGGLDVRCSERT